MCTSAPYGLYTLRYQSSFDMLDMFMEPNTHIYKHMQTQNKTNATSNAQNTNKQATAYPYNPQSNYF